MRWFYTTATIVLGSYLAWIGLLWHEQGRLIYPGSTLHPPEPAPIAGEVRTWLGTTSGRIEAWYLPPLRAAGRAPAVIFGHGNGEIIDQWPTELNGFRERGFGVLLVEYPGYGRSTGQPSEPAIGEAVIAGYDYLARNPVVDPEVIIGYGQSLGGGAVCRLLGQRRLAGLVLQSTFPSLRIFASRYWAPPFLLRDVFDNVAALRRYSGPVLIIHGTQDRLIPIATSAALVRAAPQTTVRAYPCGHWCWDPANLPFWHDFDLFMQENHLLRGKRGAA